MLVTMARKLAHAGAWGVAMCSVAFMLGCGQTSSDANPAAGGGPPAAGGTAATGGATAPGGAAAPGGTTAAAGAETGAAPAVNGGTGGVDVTVEETTFRIVNDTDATIYAQLPSTHAIGGITVSGEYQGGHDLGDDVPFCLDCPRDTCPQWERTPLTVEAIEPGAIWERGWDGYLYKSNDDDCIEKRAWRGVTHTVEICWGTGFTSDFEDVITGESCVHREFVLGDVVEHTVTN
jgi:hypothetical protein